MTFWGTSRHGFTLGRCTSPITLFLGLNPDSPEAFNKKQSADVVAKELRSQYGSIVTDVLEELPPSRIIERLEKEKSKSALLTPAGRKFLGDLAKLLKPKS